jgi:hypothetical protein
MTVRELLQALASRQGDLDDEVMVRCEITRSYRHPIITTVNYNNTFLITANDAIDIEPDEDA